MPMPRSPRGDRKGAPKRQPEGASSPRVRFQLPEPSRPPATIAIAVVVVALVIIALIALL